MKILLQINVTCNWGSTDRIVEEIGQVTIKNGWRSCITFSRGNPTSLSQLFRIGSKWDMYEHAVESRLLDNHGLEGNIGYTHNVEYLVDVAECLKGDKYVMFCIIGEGMKKAAIMQKVKT